MAPQSPLEAILMAAASRPPQAPAALAAEYEATEGMAEAALAALEHIEASSGSSRPEARKAAERVLAAGQAIEPPSGNEPPPGAAAILRAIEALVEDVRAETLTGSPRSNSEIRLGLEEEATTTPSPGAAL